MITAFCSPPHHCPASGDDGSSCTIVQNSDGSATISCDDGSEFTLGNGTAGTAGAEALAITSAEAAGANCPDGGQRIDIGLDNGDGGGIANNGTLEAGEVDSTFFLCDGADGTDGFTSLLTSTDEPAGANCTEGGQRIDSGLDNGDGAGIANNGLLESGEIDETSYVCNGSSTPLPAHLAPISQPPVIPSAAESQQWTLLVS